MTRMTRWIHSWINKAILVFEHKSVPTLSAYVKKIPFLYQFIKASGVLRVLDKTILFLKRDTGIFIQADIYGTGFTMIDYKPFDYYPLLSVGKVYEPSLSQQLKKLFKGYDAPTFVDIGAYIGYFTIYAGKLTGSGGQVISIEPNVKHYARLLKNIKLNGLNEHIRAFHLALSDKDGMATMKGYDERVLHEVGDGNIRMITFDRLCEEENIRPDIIKIDVHGAEGKVLTGMPNTLQHKVSHVFCELHNDLLGYTIKEILHILEAAGLEVFEFTKHRDSSGGKLVPINNEFLSSYDDRMLYARRKGSKEGKG